MRVSIITHIIQHYYKFTSLIRGNNSIIQLQLAIFLSVNCMKYVEKNRNVICYEIFHILDINSGERGLVAGGENGCNPGSRKKERFRFAD